ncbi:GXWXG domain-containing protein [Mycobacterium sp. NPDC051804]|uniref:GXWXG domain-containing protein n=1 Tax=Mycobacterium sp. NPDC051804 TaxID=3364295 RepID=UPI0037944E31
MRTMTGRAAIDLFDALPPCPKDMLRGCWSGREVHTGHPLDGALANVSWYGKRFDDNDRVHPLVVMDAAGSPFPLDPEVVPMRLITSPVWTPAFVKTIAPQLMSLLRPVVRARTYGAHLELLTYRGVRTAAMVYNSRPIIDVFRQIDDDTTLGLMAYPGMPRPHFFVLERDTARSRCESH